MKIEVNVVFRGTVLPVEYRSLSTRTSDLFGVEFETPILARDELYAGKLVAALDRQHPRVPGWISAFPHLLDFDRFNGTPDLWTLDNAPSAT